MNFAEIKQYQSFQTLTQLNEAVRAFLYRHKAELSDGTVKVLKFIWKHSCKVLGVSFAKYDYIANGAELSKRTVIRAVNTLEEYGILKRVPTKKPNGKRGVNLLVFQAIEGVTLPDMSPQRDTAPVTPTEPDKPNNTNDSEPISESEALKKQCSFQGSKDQKNSKDVKDTSIQSEYMDASFVPDNVPQEFTKTMQPFFGAEIIFKLWGKVLLAFEKMGQVCPSVDIAIRAAKQMVFMYRNKKIRGDIFGYLFGTLCGMIAIHQRQQVHIPNWLEDDDM